MFLHLQAAAPIRSRYVKIAWACGQAVRKEKKELLWSGQQRYHPAQQERRQGVGTGVNAAFICKPHIKVIN